MNTFKKIVRKLLPSKEDASSVPKDKPKAAKPKKSKQNPRMKKRISKVMDATGWDYRTAKEKMHHAYKTFGIGSKDYIKYALYAVSDEELEAKAAKILEKKALLNEQKEECIEKTMQGLSVDRETAIKHVTYAHKNLKLTYRKYIIEKFYRIPFEDLDEEHARYLERKAKESDDRPYREQQIMDSMGWTRKELRADYKAIRSRIHCTWAEYWQFRLYALTEEEQDTFYLKAHQAVIRQKFRRASHLKGIYDSKERANGFFAEYIKRPWCVNNECTFERFEELFRDSAGIIYKPVFGLQARNVEAFRFSEHSLREVYDTISDYPRGVVEGLIIQHPDMSLLNPSSVNCMRVMSISSESIPVTKGGKYADIAAISLKMGGDSSVVDNLHAGGGVVAGVDVITGVVLTDGVNWDGESFRCHPVTGTEIRGFKIPYFEEAKAMVYEMIEKLHITGIVGWDIAISEDGPVLIEPNAVPDPVLLNLPFSPERRGIKNQMEKYM